MSKLCLTCDKPVDDLTEDLFSHDEKVIPEWYKKIGNYSLLPPPINRNPKYNLYGKKNIKESYPSGYDTKLKVNNNEFTPDTKKTWVFYWVARSRNYHKTSYQQPEQAYGDFYNCGLTRVDQNGDITFRFDNPYPYQYNNVKYPPHLHFVYLKSSGLWEDKCNTMIITPDIDLSDFKYMISSDKYFVINAIPEEAKLPIIYNTVRIAFNTDLDQINKIISENIDSHLVKKHGKIQNVPIVIYCKNKDCNASDLLIEKLRKLGYVNLLKFSGGIEKYYHKKF